MTTGGKAGRGSDPDRRPTKAERREQERLKREQIQQQMSRRRRNRSIGLILVTVAVVTAVAVAFFPTGGGSGIASASDLLKQAPDAQKSAGCDAVKTIDFYDGVSDTNSPDYRDQTHIGANSAFPTPPKLSTYPSTPPTSGPHDQTPLPAGVYDTPPSIYQAIHSLEHGGAIVWYAPGTSSKELDALKAFYGQRASEAKVGQDRVIVAPYDYPNEGAAGQLPAGVEMALVAWHRLQTCSQVSLAAAFDFTSQYSFPTYGGRKWKGVAPERGGTM